MFRRDTSDLTATIASGANLSDAIDFQAFSVLVVHMPAAWTAASIGFKVSNTQDGTYQAAYDDNGALLQIDSPAASKSYVSPAQLSACHWVKLWSQDGAGANTNQAAARSLRCGLKA